MYTRRCSRPPDSWSVVFEEQKLPTAKSNKGRVQAYDARSTSRRRGLPDGQKPELGIKNVRAEPRRQYGRRRSELLRKQHRWCRRYWHDATCRCRTSRPRASWLGSWPFQATRWPPTSAGPRARCRAEGATGWADTTMLASNAKHPNCAYKWMEWSLNAKVQGDVARGSARCRSACRVHGQRAARRRGCATNGFDNFDKIHFWRTPEAACHAGNLRCRTAAGPRITWRSWAGDSRRPLRHVGAAPA